MNTELRQALREPAGRNPQPSAAILDSRPVKTVEGGDQRGYEARKKKNRRKRHLVADTMGLVLLILADGGYRGSLIEWVKFALGWRLQIVEKLGGQAQASL